MPRPKLPRRCSEFPRPGCAEFLAKDAGPNAKTCSSACRSARARRIKSGRRHGRPPDMTPEQQESLEDIAHEVMAEELRPVVREALTEQNMRALRDMVGLLPSVVEQLEIDVTDKDPLVRQKAHTLVLRYTLAHQSALPKDDGPGAGLVVINAMPRPGSDSTAAEATPADATEVQECDVCHLEKPTADFVGDSQRCRQCMNNLQSKVQGFLGKADD